MLREAGIDSPDQIYNWDESGFPLQNTTSMKVCTDKYVKRSFQITSPTKTSISTLLCICGNGDVLPPAIIYPGKNFNAEYAYRFPKDFFVGFTDNGWMETTQFYGWIANHFLKQIPPKRPVVLLLDGHSSHIDYHTSMLCKENGIFLFRFPPHTSHVLQPTDKCFFQQFKCNFKISCAKFSAENPAMCVTKRTFVDVFTEAYFNSKQAKYVISSFKATGIWPVNENVIDRAALRPAQTFTDAEITATIAPETAMTSKACSSSLATSQPNPSNEKESEHSHYKALKALEKVAWPADLFNYRYKEKYDVEDALYNSWRGLTMEWEKIQEEIEKCSFGSGSSEIKDSQQILNRILVYPSVPRKKGMFDVKS